MSTVSSRNPDRWRQIEDLFHGASERTRENRSAFLDETCGTNSELREEVESLLAGLDESATPFLEAAVQGAARAYVDPELPLLDAGSCLDHYAVIRMLGAGGMGEVYLAEDTKLKRKVALKMLCKPLTHNPAALRRLEQEAQVVSGLNHANLLTVFDFCHADGRYFPVTEFVEGETLRQILNNGRLPQSKAVDLATQIAAALSAAHGSGVIHRDIKPENIIVRTDGCVKVLDFGIAKLVSAPERQNTQRTSALNTAAGAVMGTPRYMSPEQARGVEVDSRTDIFSLGAVFYEMLTGRTAFEGETQSDLIADILRGEPLPLRKCLPAASKALERIVSLALAKNREQRYKTADEMLADLQGIRRDEEFRSRSRTGLGFWKPLVVLLVLLTGISALVIRQRVQWKAEVAPRSLAVLPFRNLRPSSSTDFLSFSLADQVIAKLGYVKPLTVRPSSEINRYRDGTGELSKVAKDLNAGMILTGTYLRDGDDLRITARLIGFNPESVLWQDTLNVKYGNLLSIQDSVAQMVIQGLELRLGSDEQSRIKTNASVNGLAYEYYLRGVDLYSISNFPAAIAMLEKSTAIDATYAPTWAHLGRAYTTNASLQFGG